MEENGYMQKLLHTKANALQAIYDITQQITDSMSTMDDLETYTRIIELLNARKEQMQEIDVLDKRITFLIESGYEVREDEGRIQAERDVIRALLQKIQALDEANNQRIQEARETLMSTMREVKDGQKSIHAYAPATDEEEGQQLDMRR